MKFIKPKGSTADLREIEYISALHQTAETLRKDGTITSDDISMFLISRYGIEASSEHITNTIMKGFGGGGISESDGATMDLTEIVAMLLIPTLVRIKRGMMEEKSNHVVDSDADEVVGGNFIVGHGNVVDEFDNKSTTNEQSARTVDLSSSNTYGQSEPIINTNESLMVRKPKKLFRYVLKMILADTIQNDSSPPPLTVDLLRSIFLFYGEKEVAADKDLLQGMVDLAKDAGDNLDEYVFANCCTSDVELYDIESEQRLSSTYLDVFGTHGSTKKKKRLFNRQFMEDVESSVPNNASEGEEGSEKVNEVLKRYTFPAIDYAVDTFRSKVCTMVF